MGFVTQAPALIAFGYSGLCLVLALRNLVHRCTTGLR